ncbi:MAG: S8 family serine peptidase, partial [Allosphingosinicella sp.]
MRNFRRATLALSVGWSALALAGCGGGGSRPQPAPPPPPVAAPAPAPTATPTPPPPPPPPTTTATNFNDAEYRRSNGATSSGAISAWDRGATGGNVTIGVVDSGINPNLSDFAGKVHSGSRDLVGNRGVTDSDGHGTAVSAVAAAARNGEGTMGVAFGSQILSLNAQDPNNCNDKDGCLFPDSAIAAGIDSARTNGARVINLSLGGDGVSSRVIAAIQRAAASGIVIVVSAGNDGHTNPSAFASQIAAAAGANVIIAGSVGVAGADGTDLTQMSTFSNLAGGSGQNYLAALGFRVTAPDQNGRLMSWNGTSFSAPVISGAAALLASAFPHLTGAQIVEILMGSADDLGQAGIDSVYGRGRLNITRAFEPQG